MIRTAEQNVIAAAREFLESGTVLTMCNRGPCQRVVEDKDNSDPQAKLIAALKALDRAALATEEE